MHQPAEDSAARPPARIVADAVRLWPSAELALLVVLLKRILDERATHAREGGGVIDRLKQNENHP